MLSFLGGSRISVKVFARNLSMIALSDYIYRYCSCCLNCGSFIVQEGGLCVACNASCIDLEATKDLFISGLPVKVLFNWRPGESDLLSKLILFLKGGKAVWIWRHYAQWLAKREIGTINHALPLYIIPAPAKKRGHKDHAYVLGEALVSLIGGRLFPCLSRVSTTHQRFADIHERSFAEMEVLEKYTNSEDLAGTAVWIFVDDVVTTGATAQAAYRALGCPANFQVWALAHRSLSCGASRDLLYKPHE